ncbi:MAG: cytochrome P450 [Anaerolineae bacterium]
MNLKETSFPIGFALTLLELESDVHPILHKLRQAEPVSWVPVIDCWLVTDRDLCIKIMRDAKTYTVDHPGFTTAQVVGSSMLSLDGVEHGKHRAPFDKPFRKREVENRYEGLVSNFANELIDGFIAGGRAELRREFCGPIAVKTMIAALGMENISVEEVLTLNDRIVDAVTRLTAGEPISPEGSAAFETLKSKLIPALAHEPESNMLAAAVGNIGSLSVDEAISNAAILLFGGIETTEGMIANAMYHLLTNPDVLARVKEDVTLIPAVIEESLRLEPAASAVDRYTTLDVQIGNVTIKEGDLVRVSLAASNRDPAVFPNPDQFDPTRKNLRSHVTWAHGPHVCLGLHLARLEAQKSVELLIQRLPNIAAKNVNEAVPAGLIFRKPEALNVSW